MDRRAALWIGVARGLNDVVETSVQHAQASMGVDRRRPRILYFARPGARRSEPPEKNAGLRKLLDAGSPAWAASPPSVTYTCPSGSMLTATGSLN